MVETVDKHCEHPDCKYRGVMTGLGYGVHWRMYLDVTGKLRGCDISKCDKYAPGKPARKNTDYGWTWADDERNV